MRASRRLYSQLLESARYHRTLLQRCLARL